VFDKSERVFALYVDTEKLCWPRIQDRMTALFIWGHGPWIYMEARRRPACRYILTFPLTGRVLGGPLPGVDTRKWIVPGAWNILEQDFCKHPPIYIVDLEHGREERYPVRDFPILARLLEDRYQPVLQATWGVIYRLRQAN
jgi:hypothetical protein